MTQNKTPQQHNVLAQTRGAEVSVSFNGELKVFKFSFNRSQVADMINEVSSAGARAMDVTRKWVLIGVDPAQKEELLSWVNHPDNFTLENDIMATLTPFLRQNKATIGGLITGG